MLAMILALSAILGLGFSPKITATEVAALM